MTTKKLIPSTDLKNTKRTGLGWEMLDSTAGAFVVLEECSHSAPYEIGRFTHDGTAVNRANAFREAQTLAGSRDKYNGEGFSFNTYEEEAAPVEPQAAALAAMTYAEVKTVSMVASTVRHGLRKKDISLRSLRAIDASRPRYNPFDSSAFRMTTAVWDLVLTVIGTRIDDTCKALVDLEYAADREAQRRDTPAEPAAPVAPVKPALAPLSVGDRINDGGAIRHVTAVRPGGAIVVIDNLIELAANGVHRVETCRALCERIAKACGISHDYAFQAFSGADFDEAAAIATVKRTQQRHTSADQLAREFVEAPITPAADIYRMTWAEVVEAMKVERAQPCGTKPTARAFLALMIGRDQSHLTPDRDTVCDILKTHFVNCYQHGVLDPQEFAKADQLAATAERPRDLLEALRTALLRGLNIVEALKL